MSSCTSRSSGSEDVDGVRIHYLVAGDDCAPVLLMIHGYPQTSLAWRKVIAPLTEAGFRLIMPDLRGAGGSSRPLAGYDKQTLAGDCAAVLDALDVAQPVTVVGHDIGAMVTYAFAHRFPDRTSRLAVLDAPLPGTDLFDRISADGARVWHFHFHQARDLPEALTQGREALYLERFYHDMAYDAGAIEQEAFAAYVREFSKPGAMRAGFELYRSFGQDIADNRRALVSHGKLKMPVLAVTGSAGRYRDTIGDMMRTVAEHVQTVVIEHAGHWLAEENPAALAGAIAEFALASDSADPAK